MQAVASAMGHLLPVLAPALTAEAGIAPESIGPLNAVAAAGTILFLLFGGALLARLGPIRALQAGTAVSAVGLLLAGAGTLPAFLAAALLLGLGYGPTPPAGSRILAATAPPRHRTLIFSVKQAGAPLGGMVAGLLAAPAAAALGWRATLLLAAGLALLCAAAIQPLRRGLDGERDRARRVSPGALLGRANLAAPFAALRVDPLLWPLTALGFGFAVAQGCLFAFCVTWLVAAHGLSLVAAGTVFAAMQGSGIVARIALGWLADRTGRAARNLVVQAFAAAAMLALLALLPAGTPAWLLLAVAAANGFLSASWNGIVLAEVARLAPPSRIQDATSGSTLVVFCGYVLGPALFGALVPLLGGWDVPFLLVAGQLAVGGVVMAGKMRGSR